MFDPRARVVLARPRNTDNIENTYRCSRWAGIDHMTIVPPEQSDLNENRLRGTGIQICDTLHEAVRDCSLVAGVTRRWGQRRKTVYFSPEAAITRSLTGSGATAFVFGNETSGLSDEELAICHIGVTISTSSSCPSLNLSHAVAVICYELRLQTESKSDGRDRKPAKTDVDPIVRQPVNPEIGVDSRETITCKLIEDASQHIAGRLTESGYLVQEGAQGMRYFLRDFIARSAPSPVELSRFVKIFDAISTRLHDCSEDNPDL